MEPPSNTKSRQSTYSPLIFLSWKIRWLMALSRAAGNFSPQPLKQKSSSLRPPSSSTSEMKPWSRAHVSLVGGHYQQRFAAPDLAGHRLVGRRYLAEHGGPVGVDVRPSQHHAALWLPFGREPVFLITRHVVLFCCALSVSFLSKTMQRYRKNLFFPTYYRKFIVILHLQTAKSREQQ